MNRHRAILFLFAALCIFWHGRIVCAAPDSSKTKNVQAVPLDQNKQEKPFSDPAMPRSKSSALKSIKGVASGVSEVVGSGPKKLISETVDETKSGPPIVGTVQGVQKGAAALVDSTVKGTYKVATLGLGELESVEHEEPVKSSDTELVGSKKEGKPATFKIKIPGT